LLLRGSTPVPLSPKVFDTLLLMLQNPDRLLTKDEIMAAIWPGRVVEESNLSQYVFVLRKALKDDSEDRWIVTSPGRGYRFTAAVRRMTPRADEPEALTSAVPRRLSAWLRSRQAAWTVGCLILVAGLVWWQRHLTSAPLALERSTVLLTGIGNLTGDPAFDSVPESVLEIGLSQSPFLSLIAPQQVANTLKLMELPVDSTLSADLAREVCLRNDGKATLGGSISAFGTHYIAILEAHDCNSGQRIVQSKVDISSKQDVPQALDGLTATLRTHLGESLPSVQRLGIPIQQVTTRSFAALQAYSVGERTRQQGDNNAAVPLFQRATELDPSFALAYAELAAAYIALRQPELARPNYAKAFQLRDRTSEKERLWISAEYFKLVGNLSEAINNYRAMAQLYPRDGRPMESLADLYTRLARYDDAVAAARDGLRLNPDDSRAYSILARAYKRSNHYVEAKQIAEQAIAKNLAGWEMHCLLYEVSFAVNDDDGMAEGEALERGKPNEAWMVEYEALSAATSGQIKLARDRFEHAIALMSATGGDSRRATIADFYTDYIQMLAHVGLESEARRIAAQIPDLDNNEEAPYALALSGDFQRATAIDQHFGTQYPDSALSNNFTRPRTQAAVALGQHRPEQAVAILQPALPSKLRTLDVPYLLGQAYLELKQPDRAAAEFTEILAHRGVDAIDPLFPLAYIGLARALRMQGQILQSQSAYESFLKFWAKADPDAPLLGLARQEYAELATFAAARVPTACPANVSAGCDPGQSLKPLEPPQARQPVVAPH
jgi:DNA-binding winged helix-turn-helix (wHTH) protein/tetratricopeptide (TPR) repeat protein